MDEIEMVTPDDQGAREEALDTHQSCIVQAPAGSGKTELLTQRFLHLLSEVESPEQILAITFTRAATAEMRRRILESLERAIGSDAIADPALEPARRALRHAEAQGWQLLKNPQLLRIETIDSFCLSLAHRTPLLARLGGTFQPTESAGPLYALAARRTLQHLGGQDRELTEAITALLKLRDNGLSDCEQLIAHMLSLRDQWQHAYVLNQQQDWQDQVRTELERPMARAIKRKLRLLEAMLKSAGADGAQLAALASFACRNLNLPECGKYSRHLAKISALAEYDNFPPCTEDQVEAWKALACFLLTVDGTWRKSVTVAVGFPSSSKKEKDLLLEIVSELESIAGFREVLCEVTALPPARYTNEQWDLLRKLFVTLRRATAELDVVFTEQNAVDFVEIGLAAGRVLQQRDEVLGEIPTEFALAKSDQLRHLLVDEFQDTSRRQQRLVSMLVRGWAEEEGKTCFLVGDPMQSIYLFRQAEVELFHHASAHGLGSGADVLPLKRLRLTTNFRSDRGVVDPLNAILAPIFAQSSSPDAAPVEFTPSEASDREPYSPNVHIVANLIAPQASGRTSNADRQQAQEREAEQVLAIINAHMARIHDAIRNNVGYRLAVLARARKHLLPIANVLRKAGIPFRAIEMENLRERQEVLDLTSLMHALFHPMDRVAWLAALRAPWCGLMLDDLHQLCGADDRSFANVPVLELLRNRSSLLSADGRGRVRNTLPVLEEAMRQRYKRSSSQSLAMWMERTWRSLGGPDCVDAIAYENTQVFFSMLEEMNADGIGCLGRELNDKLTRLFAQPNPAASESAGVQLMTMHKAKGLGFDVVIVPGLDRQPNADKAKLLSWLERSIPANELAAEEGRDSEILVAPIGGKGEDTNSLSAWVNRQERMRLAEEQKRLFYVACTRARHELHLLGTALIKEKRDSKSKEITYSLMAGGASSLLRTAWPSLEAPFVQALDTWRQQRSAAPTQLNFPQQFGRSPEGGLSLAASEERPSILRRLPSDFLPSTPRRNVTVTATYFDESSSADLFWRPAGSIRARAFGIAVHALLAKAARLLEEGTSPDDAKKRLSGAKRTVENLLRREGVPTSQTASLSEDVIRAVTGMLEEEAGIWILSPHPEAECEAAWTGWLKGAARSVRADRVFRGGPTIAAPGDDVYWIIDYKTASHGDKGIEDFLERQKAEYESQLNAYAEVLRLLKGSDIRIRLGLYYPLLRRLESWFA